MRQRLASSWALLWIAIVIGALVSSSIPKWDWLQPQLVNNQNMAAANGINNDAMKIIIYMLSNGLIALSGSLMAQTNGYADLSMGIGTIVIALAAIIISKSWCARCRCGRALLMIIVGAVIYRLIIAVVLDMGVDPNYLRLLLRTHVDDFLITAVIEKKLFQVKYDTAIGNRSSLTNAWLPKHPDHMTIAPAEQQRRFINMAVLDIARVAPIF